jgi:glycosyltransferase involved in cell wall biosynthesis
MSDQAASKRKETIALIVATRNRLQYLIPRIPVWANAGFDEIIVVNTPGDTTSAEQIRVLCRTHGVRYVETPRTVRDLRSEARNLGAKEARTTWIYFSDDDVDAIAGMNRLAFENASLGRDWLAGETGDIVVLHRREAFLAFGGYPEDMVASEDGIMSNRARTYGRGGPQGELWTRIVRFQETPREEPLNQARSRFWYGLTLPLYFIRTPDFVSAVRSDLRWILKTASGIIKGQLRNFVYLWMYMAGRALSPVHLLSVLLKSGRRGFAREIQASWKDARHG